MKMEKLLTAIGLACMLVTNSIAATWTINAEANQGHAYVWTNRAGTGGYYDSDAAYDVDGNPNTQANAQAVGQSTLKIDADGASHNDTFSKGASCDTERSGSVDHDRGEANASADVFQSPDQDLGNVNCYLVVELRCETNDLDATSGSNGEITGNGWCGASRGSAKTWTLTWDIDEANNEIDWTLKEDGATDSSGSATSTWNSSLGMYVWSVVKIKSLGAVDEDEDCEFIAVISDNMSNRNGKDHWLYTSSTHDN